MNFLFSTALYLSKSNKRKFARRNRIAPASTLNESSHISPHDIEGDYIAQETNETIRKLVENLPEKFKLPTILFYTVELSISDIATALNIPEGTVKSRLYKARKLIEEGLIKNGY